MMTSSTETTDSLVALILVHVEVVIWFDPLTFDYNAYAATLQKKFAAPLGPIFPENMPGYRCSCRASMDIPSAAASLAQASGHLTEDEKLHTSLYFYHAYLGTKPPLVCP